MGNTVVSRRAKKVLIFSTRSTLVDRNGDQMVFKLSTGVFKVIRPGSSAEFFDYLWEARQAIGKGPLASQLSSLIAKGRRQLAQSREC